MTVAIIDSLEMVQIDDQSGERPAVSCEAHGLGGEDVAPVAGADVDTRRVGAGSAAEASPCFRMCDGSGGPAGEEGLLAPQVLPVAVADPGRLAADLLEAVTSND